MKKRLFAMFLVLVMMTVAVAACGKPAAGRPHRPPGQREQGADAFKENKNTEKSMVKQKIHVYTTLKNLL